MNTVDAYPKVLEPGQHPIKKEDVGLEALWIIQRLHNAGFTSYIVGGSVRDMLLGRLPKDIDISTSATPEQLQELFANIRLIGKRFLIAHIYFRDGKIIDVSTFRALPSKNHPLEIVKNDNRYGSPIEDAQRRDLTINGLFYDLHEDIVIDYVDGLEDLEQGKIRAIGNPYVSFQEDPVRMLRAIRHAARCRFEIEETTWLAIRRHATLIHQASHVRVREEFIRELQYGSARRAIRLMQSSGILRELSRTLDKWLGNTGPWKRKKGSRRRFGPYSTPSWATPAAFWRRLIELDKRMPECAFWEDGIILLFLFLPMFWAEVYQHTHPPMKTSQLWHQCFQDGLNPIVRELSLTVQQKELMEQVLQVHWRLHLYPEQRQLTNAIKRSPVLPQALKVLELELASEQMKVPSVYDTFLNRTK